MKQITQTKQNKQLGQGDDRVVVSHCLYCKCKYIYDSRFEIPPIGRRQCESCRHPGVQFYEGSRTRFDVDNALKGGTYKMADKEAKKPAKKAAAAKAKSGDKKSPRGYGDDVKTKAVALAKQGKSVTEIVKTLNGPKTKAVVRYLKDAGVKDVKRK